jgi:hypothetical protein
MYTLGVLSPPYYLEAVGEVFFTDGQPSGPNISWRKCELE